MNLAVLLEKLCPRRRAEGEARTKLYAGAMLTDDERKVLALADERLKQRQKRRLKIR